MKIVVFGSTGGTGAQVVEQALAAGHDVVAVARRPDALTTRHENLTVLQGDVLDPATLAGRLDGSEAVLSALGSHSGREPTTVYSQGMRNIRAAMGAAGVRRVVAISAVPVSAPSEKSFVDRYLAHPLLGLFFRGSYDDLRRMEADLQGATDVDWTVLRPPRLVDGPPTGTYRIAAGQQIAGARDIRRADLAAAMLDVVDDRSFFGTWAVVSR